MTYIFESERLGFRDWVEADYPKFYRINSSEEVMEFFPAVLNEEESNAFIDRIKEHIKKRDYGLWAVEIKASREFIGYVGLQYVDFPQDFTPCVEIGWRIDQAYWNKGYATEAGLRVLEYAFDHLKLDRIYAFTALINEKSEHIMKKLGMEKVGEFNHPRVDEEHKLSRHSLYSISRE